MATISYPTTIQFDYGTLGMLPPEMRRLGIHRTILANDKGFGGSAIDLAKAVALLATHPGSLQQYAVPRTAIADDYPCILNDSYRAG